MEYMFTYSEKQIFEQYIGGIEIFDNSFIGANSTIMLKLDQMQLLLQGALLLKTFQQGKLLVGIRLVLLGTTMISLIKEKILKYQRWLEKIE